MHHKLQQSVFGATPDILRILETLMPGADSRESLDLFAQQAGHGSFAAMTVWKSHEDVSPEDLLSLRAGSGRVLPLLVYAALRQEVFEKLTAAEILRIAVRVVVDEMFLQGVDDVLAATKRAPAGACRWFFAVATSNILFHHDQRVREDRFWSNKAGELVAGVLALAPDLKSFGEVDQALLVRLSEEAVPASLWEEEAAKLLSQWKTTPEKTFESVLITARHGLFGGKKEPDVGIMPGGS